MTLEKTRGLERATATVIADDPTIEDQRVMAAIEALQDCYEFREPAEVRAYLATNPDLLGLVREAASKIREFFPSDGPVVLEVLRNPEDEEDVGLFAVVPTRLGHKEAGPQLDRLVREWLVDAGRFTAGRFNVDVEFYKR